MAQSHYPPRQKCLAYNGILAVVLLALILFLLISGSTSQQNRVAIPAVILGLLLLLPLILVVYRIFTVLTTVYTLTRDYLEITWGLRRELLPIAQIDWLHPVTDFETPLPLGFTLLHGSYYTKKAVKGLGETLFIATAPEQMVLIKQDARFFVISPEDAKEFTREFEQFSQLGSLQSIQPESENLRMLWQRVWADPWAKRLLFAGAVSLALVILTSLLISLLQPQIVWVSMERVPASRAMLMPILALLFALTNTFAGLVLFIQGRLAALIRNLIWAWTILVNLILITALIFMVF